MSDLRAGSEPIERRRVRVLAGPRVVLALVALTLISAVAALGFHLATGTTATVIATPPATASPSGPVVVPEEPAAGADIVIYLTGEVEKPGVYTLPATARLTDAIAAAGGLRAGADPAAQNLARHLEDGEHIHVPKPGEAPPAAAGAATPAEGLINVNTATSEQLQQISGIGPALAERIINHRETNGPFASVDALDDVSGIGPALLSRLREKVEAK